MKNNRGQILLITVMLLATVMTIVLSVSFKSITDTQVTKLEEESQKALAAAESAIEVALKSNTDAVLGSGSLMSISGFEGSATIDSTSSSTKFTSPTIVKDGSYTFYLGNYDLTSKTITTVYNQDVTLCFQNGSTNPALDITLVKSNGVIKYVVDPNTPKRISNATTGSNCAGNSTYPYSINIPGDANSRFLIVRVLYAKTKLFFSSSIDLPVQGRTVTSKATSSTSTGVSKKVILFLSYPQIPGEFFNTSF